MALRFLGADTGKLPTIDRYELIAELASGGMATVYLARTVGVGGFERFFAIKRLHPHLRRETEFVNMFLDEARIVAEIRHPCVVPVLEVGASERGYYIVMEYIEGDALSTFLNKGILQNTPIPRHVAVKVIIDTLSGLHAAHEHTFADGRLVGIVHRDVSPQNILIDMNGVSMIADFGVALASVRMSSTRVGQLKGKVAYMAPEQAHGKNVSPSSDVFAAGIVLWECLANRRLFLEDNEGATLNRLLFEPIPGLREMSDTIPVNIERVVAKALERDTTKRYSNASEMAEALHSAARECELLGSSADVKSYVRGEIGAAIDTRRLAVREHLTRFTSGPLPFTDTSAASNTSSDSKPGDLPITSVATRRSSRVAEPRDRRPSKRSVRPSSHARTSLGPTTSPTGNVSADGVSSRTDSSISSRSSSKTTSRAAWASDSESPQTSEGSSSKKMAVWVSIGAAIGAIVIGLCLFLLQYRYSHSSEATAPSHTASVATPTTSTASTAVSHASEEPTNPQPTDVETSPLTSSTPNDTTHTLSVAASLSSSTSPSTTPQRGSGTPKTKPSATSSQRSTTPSTTATRPIPTVEANPYW